jgi:hypothetical protein
MATLVARSVHGDERVRCGVVAHGAGRVTEGGCLGRSSIDWRAHSRGGFGSCLAGCNPSPRRWRRSAEIFEGTDGAEVWSAGTQKLARLASTGST